MLKSRRDVIIATGFFTTLWANSTVERCHVHLTGFEPFAIAGVFNELKDGFITCSLVIIQNRDAFIDIPNVSEFKPLALNDHDLKDWFNATKTLDDIRNLCYQDCSIDFGYELDHSIHTKINYN